jgi:hypothetical protein
MPASLTVSPEARRKTWRGIRLYRLLAALAVQAVRSVKSSLKQSQIEPRRRSSRNLPLSSSCDCLLYDTHLPLSQFEFFGLRDLRRQVAAHVDTLSPISTQPHDSSILHCTQQGLTGVTSGSSILDFHDSLDASMFTC